MQAAIAKEGMGRPQDRTKFEDEGNLARRRCNTDQ